MQLSTVHTLVSLWKAGQVSDIQNRA